MDLNKGLILLALMAMSVGCASLNSVSQLHINSQKTGVIYGAVLAIGDANDPNEINKVCDSIGNVDNRCQNKDKYKAVFVLSKFGFADAGVGFIALADKSLNIGPNCIGGSKDCTYVKAEKEIGKLATVLEVASRPGDNKCHWSGLPRAGGTVCPAYNWDYSVNGQAGIVR